MTQQPPKQLYFKGSEDGAGDFREIKDRRRNFGPFFFLRNSREKRREKRLVRRERVISRLRRHKHKVHDKCVGVQK